jgi:ATP adenylyltransferase
LANVPVHRKDRHALAKNLSATTDSETLKLDVSNQCGEVLSTTGEPTAFARLSLFINTEMRMSHVYQPVMLRELLLRGGTATIGEIASALLKEDRAQLEYYQQITRNMVGRVLTKSRGITERHSNTYRLKHFEQLGREEIGRLVHLCDRRIRAFLEKRSDPWSHRRVSAGYVSGTLRYEVLKRAKFRCELCGTSAEVRAIEVDHILPRNHGGTDDITNLQALCYSCNAMKRDRDDTDFRAVSASYSHRESSCIFCEMDSARIIAEDGLCYAVRDGHPVTDLHTLVIPKRHVADYFGLHQPERNSAERLLSALRTSICAIDPSVTGFNIGMNAGADAGQTIFHCHIHLIPRRNGDVANPRGGVRGVIPEKQSY